MRVMRICVIFGTERKLHRGFELEIVGTVGAVEIQRLIFERRVGRRAIKRGVRRLYAPESVCFAAEEGFPYSDMGNSLKSNMLLIRRLEAAKLSDMALCFAKTLGYKIQDTRFIFRTGGVSDIYNAATALGERTRHIVLSCMSGEHIAEKLLVETGAVVRLASEITGDFKSEIEIFFSEDTGAILRAGEREVSISDFEILLPSEYSRLIPQKCAYEAASILLSYGFIRADEMKIMQKICIK